MFGMCESAEREPEECDCDHEEPSCRVADTWYTCCLNASNDLDLCQEELEHAENMNNYYWSCCLGATRTPYDDDDEE